MVAAAVILPPSYQHPLLNDSKKIPRKLREQLREDVVRDAVAWAIGEATPQEIDQINILQASYLAMHRTIEKLPMVPEYLLVDGNRFKPYGILPCSCILKGDSTYLSVAAASILAKTYRDERMCALAAEFGQYG